LQTAYLLQVVLLPFGNAAEGNICNAHICFDLALWKKNCLFNQIPLFNKTKLHFLFLFVMVLIDSVSTI
jgi:hypothetical protein